MKSRLPPYIFRIIAAGFWLLAFARLVWLFRNTGGVIGWDFRIYTAAVERAAAGLDPYQAGQIGTGFVNHPALLLFAAPFRWAGAVGFPAWLTLSLAAWPLTLGLAAAGKPGARTLVLLLPLTAAVEAVFMGQASIPAALCLAGAYHLSRSGRDGMAGILAGLGVIFKLSLGILGIYYVLRRRPRAAASMGAVIIGMSIGAELVFYRGINAQFIRAMLGLYAEHHPGAQNASLVGVPFFLPIALLLLAGLAVRAYRAGADGWLVFGGFAAWTLLVSPLTWHHHFVLLAVPLVRLLEPGGSDPPGPPDMGAPPRTPSGMPVHRSPQAALSGARRSSGRSRSGRDIQHARSSQIHAVALAGLIQADLVGAYLGLPFHTAILAAAALLFMAIFRLDSHP